MTQSAVKMIIHPAVRISLLFLLAPLWVACSSGPSPKDWQQNTSSDLNTVKVAYLAGNSKVAASAAKAARKDVAATAKLREMAQIELYMCALQVASLAGSACPEFAPYSADASSDQLAYASYLQGQISPRDVPLLPPEQQTVALGSVSREKLAQISDPLSRLLAAGVALQSERLQPEALDLLVNTASDEGWTRPLMAWLMAQAAHAQKKGDTALVAQIQRRLDLIAKVQPATP